MHNESDFQKHMKAIEEFQDWLKAEGMCVAHTREQKENTKRTYDAIEFMLAEIVRLRNLNTELSRSVQRLKKDVG